MSHFLMNFSTFPTEQMAWQLAAEHRNIVPFLPLRYAGRSLTLDEAYGVQEAHVAALVAQRGDALAGYKIGLTSAAMQAMCGIDRPIYGCILRSTVHSNGASINSNDFGHLGIEFEIAVKLADDLPINGAALTGAEVARHVAEVCPAFELVDDRRADYETLDGASLAADNAWSAGVVLGCWQPLPPDLETRSGRVAVDDRTIAEARLSDAMGHPLDAVAWLAHELGQRGKTLSAGVIIMTGSIARTQFPSMEQRWTYEVEGLGKVELKC